MGTDFEFEPQDVMDFVMGEGQEGLNALKQDLIKLASALNQCQDSFHGSGRSGATSSIYQLYCKFSDILGSANGTNTVGAWGTAYEIRNLLNQSYTVAKNYQETMEENEAMLAGFNSK